jgi:hypothetical protein
VKWTVAENRPVAYLKGRMSRLAAAVAIAFLVSVAFDSEAGVQKPRSWPTVETANGMWNGRGPVRFVLQIPTDHDAGGEFTRVRIRVPGEREFVVTDEDGLIAFTGKYELIPKQLQRQSLGRMKSERLLMLPMDGENALLFLIGYGYASSPGSLHVIELGPTGPPKEILYKKELGLEDVVDLDGDGRKELVAYPCLSQSYGAYLLTYDPMQVFKLDGGRLQPSLALSKEYNLKHYVWAGPECSEEFGVLAVPGQKRQVFPKDEAERQDALAVKKFGKNKDRE